MFSVKTTQKASKQLQFWHGFGNMMNPRDLAMLIISANGKSRRNIKKDILEGGGLNEKTGVSVTSISYNIFS
jgi:hypothetical protein